MRMKSYFEDLIKGLVGQGAVPYLRSEVFRESCKKETERFREAFYAADSGDGEQLFRGWRRLAKP